MDDYTDNVSLKRLTGILEGYLIEEKWATEKRLEGEVFKSHSVNELRIVMEGPGSPYLKGINPQRFETVRNKFLK